MIISERLRTLREAKNLSQGDVATRTGLLRCYLSRVENGHTVPSVETLEKIARGLELALYQLVYDGPDPPARTGNRAGANGWGSEGKAARFLNKLRRYLALLNDRDRAILMSTVAYMATRRRRRSKKF